MEGLQADTLKLLQDTAVGASRAIDKLAVITPPSEPKHVYLTINPKGEFQRFEAVAAPRSHKLVTLEQVAAFVTAKGDSKATVVWYDRDGITVVVDDATRRDTAHLTLSFTPQIKTLLRLEKDEPKMNLIAFRRLLRVDLAGTTVDRVLLNWLGSVKFTDSRVTSASLKQGEGNLGKTIEQAAVSQAGEVPEMVKLKLRVFDDPSLTETWPIDCAVEIDLDNQQFQLLPYPLQLHDAIENEVGAIGKALLETIKCPVFRGKP